VRLINRLAAILLALTLLGGGALVIIEVFAVALHRPGLVVDHESWYRALTTTRLRDPWVRTGIVTAGVLGLLILVGQTVRWKPERLPTRLADGWHLQRRSVERHLAGTADSVPGVAFASVMVRREGGGWRTRVRAVGEASLGTAVENAVRRELARLGADPDDPVHVDMVGPRPVPLAGIRLRR
jgi:hypothetical protein